MAMSLTGFVAAGLFCSSGAIGVTGAATSLTFFAFAAGLRSSAGAVLSGAGGLTGLSFATSLYRRCCRCFSN